MKERIMYQIHIQILKPDSRSEGSFPHSGSVANERVLIGFLCSISQTSLSTVKKIYLYTIMIKVIIEIRIHKTAPKRITRQPTAFNNLTERLVPIRNKVKVSPTFEISTIYERMPATAGT